MISGGQLCASPVEHWWGNHKQYRKLHCLLHSPCNFGGTAISQGRNDALIIICTFEDCSETLDNKARWTKKDRVQILGGNL